MSAAIVETQTLDRPPPAEEDYEYSGDLEAILFTDCRNGLGVKIIGGVKDEAGREYGIFVRRLIAGSQASQSGRLREGDLIVAVNGESLMKVNNDTAVDMLRRAAATDRIELIVTRNEIAQQEYLALVENQDVYSSSNYSDEVSSTHSSMSGGDRAAAWQHRPPDPRPHPRRGGQEETSSTASTLTDAGENSPVSRKSPPPDINKVAIAISTGLGISISGGTNHPDGPGIFLEKILEGGDVMKDGRLQVNDQLVAINKEVTVGITHEEAKAILTRLRLRAVNLVEIAFVRGQQQLTVEMLPRLSQRLVSPYQEAAAQRLSPSRAADNLSPLTSHISPLSLATRTSPSPSQGLSQRNLNSLSMEAPSLQPRLSVQPKMASTPQIANVLGGTGLKLPARPQQSPGALGAAAGLSLSPVMAANQSRDPIGQPTPSRSMTAKRARNLSLDPKVKLKVSKLEVALKYLGLEPGEEQKRELYKRLNIDSSGSVLYGDFVKTARDVFKFQFNELSTDEQPTMFTASDHGMARDITDFAEPPDFQPQLYETPATSYEDIEDLRDKHDRALREIERLRISLKEKEEACNAAEEELLRIRREAQGAIHESRSLRSKVHLAEAAQHEARNMEMDYEEVVRMLEQQVAQFKAKETPPRKDNTAELQKRLAVLGCQMRKTEAGKKTYEVATERLLHFAEMVHETLVHGSGSSAQASAGGGLSGRERGEAGPRQGEGGAVLPPGFLASRRSGHKDVDLAAEARDTVRAVKSLLEVEPLPYGWDEAYTANGMKYYINHVSQSTRWTHPVTNMAPAGEGAASDMTETRM